MGGVGEGDRVHKNQPQMDIHTHTVYPMVALKDCPFDNITIFPNTNLKKKN